MRRLDEGIVYAKTANAAFGFEVTDSQFGRRWRVLKATEAGRTALAEGLVAADRRDAARAAAARRCATDATTAPRFKPSTETPATFCVPTDTFEQQLAETLASLPSPPSTPPGARAPRPTSQANAEAELRAEVEELRAEQQRLLAAKAERVRREAAERAAADLHGGGTPESPSPPDEPSSPVETQSCLANPAISTPPTLGVAKPVREPLAPEATPPVHAPLS